MATQTTTSQATTARQEGDVVSLLPATLPTDLLAHFPKLTRAQAGHIRHFHNLASLPDGEWRHMGGQDPGQESFEAYRYQIATMAYAASLAHYHRAPSLRAVFRTLLEQLIHKMLRRDVWGFWYLTSQSGTFVDPDLTALRAPWPDPVRRENIMYSGHLLLMVSLHAMLFDSDKYDAEGALTFNWNPMFFGLGPETFRYTRTSLQETVLADMERSQWMGVCCEPNCVFVICNQFPIIAMRYNDVRNGTDVTTGVLKAYTQAWKDKNGGFTRPGPWGEHDFVFFWRIKQDQIMPNFTGIWANAWASTFMNAWNADFVHDVFPKQIRGFLTRFPDGRVSLNTPAVAKAIRNAQGNGDGDEAACALTVPPAALEKALAATAPMRAVPTPMGTPESGFDFGHTVMWVSEVAPDASSSSSSSSSSSQNDLLAGLLKHADEYLDPKWEDGGLFYPRKASLACEDQAGNWIGTDPHSGNAGIAYGRLNVRNGQKKMWDEPWTREGHHAEYPVVEGVDLSSGVDFLRGEWRNDLGALAVTMRTWDSRKTKVELRVQNLPTGLYGVYQSGHLTQCQHVQKGEVVEVSVEVGGDEVDVVLVQQQK